jgi:hypothetical protein
MTTLLLGPPARRAILARTFTNPARDYHLRELVRLTGLAPRSVQQEVEKLVTAGLLVERAAATAATCAPTMSTRSSGRSRRSSSRRRVWPTY